MDYLKIYSYNGIHLGQHISEFYSTLVPENIFQGMSISYVFQKDNKLCLKRKIMLFVMKIQLLFGY